MLQQPQSWPNPLLSRVQDHHTRWLACLQNTSLSSLDAALGFIHSCDGIEAALVGVLTTKELLEILKAQEKAQTMNFLLICLLIGLGIMNQILTRVNGQPGLDYWLNKIHLNTLFAFLAKNRLFL